jgi:pyruvate dehydrogenase (quinone)
MMSGCDTLLMIGSGFPYAEFLPKEGAARGVQIDIEPAMLGIRYPMELNLVGDAAATLKQLLPLLHPKTDRTWRKQIEHSVAKWWKTLENRAMSSAKPLNPQRVFWELSPLLPENAMIACDTGTAASWYARDLRMRGTMQAAHSGTLASMGAGLPYAIAAKFAYPERPVFAFIGDGAMQMNGINEMITVCKYWRRWKDPRFVILVLNNRDLNMVSWEQRVIDGDPRFAGSQDLPDFHYAAYAKMLGFDGFRVDRPENVTKVWKSALACKRPVLVEAMVDPNVPALPPNVSLTQARNYLGALLSGDKDALNIVKATIKEILQ